ncbi:MAG: signal peptidase II [Chloroflexi bacterium]|nr:signal peptidase II [Chloroflexota bacterium]
MTPAVGIVRRPRWPLFAAIGIVVVVVDQLVKAAIASTYEVGVPVAVLGDLVRIDVSHNEGALFGLFQGSALVFGVGSLAVVGLIVWYEARAGDSLLVTFALGLLVGGAVGNLLDRLRLGYVIDFVDAGVGGWRWYTFNIADAAISTAIVLLIILALLPPERTRPGRG